MLYKRLRQNPFSGVGMDQGVFPPWYNTIYTNSPNTAGYNPALELCDYWEQTPGNLFQYAYLDVSVPGDGPATLNAGVVLTDAAAGADTVSALLTDPVTSQVYGITLVTGGLTPNAEVGNWLFMLDIGIARQILANTGTDIIFSLRDTIPSGLDVFALPAGTGPTGASVVSIYRPGHVVVNATPVYPVGIVLNDVVEGQPIVMQVSGLSLILGSNANAALVSGDPALVASSGIISGGTLPFSQTLDAMIVPQVSYDSGSVAQILCQFKAAGLP